MKNLIAMAQVAIREFERLERVVKNPEDVRLVQARIAELDAELRAIGPEL